LQRSSSVPRLPLRDGLVDFRKDELIEDVVVEEAREDRDPCFEEVDGGSRFFGGPVVAEEGRRSEKVSFRARRFRRRTRVVRGTHLIADRTFGSQTFHIRLS